MFKLKHPHVRILEGIKELIGQTGLIVDKEGKQYRVRLDTPVTIPNVGLVTENLWMPAMLKVIRPRHASSAPTLVAIRRAGRSRTGRRHGRGAGDRDRG